MAMANHILMFPFHAQGHLTVMLHLAELLSKSNHNIHITFIDNNFYNFPVHTPRSLEYYSGLPNFRFLSLNTPPEELPKSFHELIGLEESRRLSCKDEYRRVLGPLEGWPRVTCVVADSFVSLALDVPDELGIPIMILNTASAASVWFYYCMPAFLEANDLPFQDDHSDYDKDVHAIPGMEGILRRRDLHSFVTEAKCKNDQVLQYMLTTGKNLSRAKALIINTIEAAELPILSRIRSTFPATYTIAPLHMLVDHRLKHDTVKDDRVDGGTSHSCLSWLDSKPVKSVLYVSFGSTTRMSKDELLELWHGLVDSGYPFLWAMRKDLLIGSEEDGSSIEKLEEAELLLDATKERGCIVGWVPQNEVLGHPSVGCFMTHSGWNSVLESIGAGVPMICWPFLADHPINCRFVAQVWKIGLDMRGPMQRSVVEKAVNEAMEGDGAREMRRSVAQLSKLTRQSVEDGGSSSKDFDALVQHILSLGV